MMSFGSQDGRSHPRVRFGRDPSGSKWGVKIDESAEDTVLLLSQFGGIEFSVLNQIRIFDVAHKGFHIDGLQFTVRDGLRYSVTVVCRYFQISNNRKIIRNGIRHGQNVTPFRLNHDQESDREYG